MQWAAFSRSLLEPLDLASILERSLQVLISVPWLSIEPQGAIFLADLELNELQMKAHVGLPCAVLGACNQVPFGQCLCGQAAASRKLVFADRVDDRHTTRYDGIAPHGHYCVPLVSDEVLLGVLTLYLKPKHSRQPEEQQFLESAADVLAGVIKRKQAEEALQQE